MLKKILLTVIIIGTLGNCTTIINPTPTPSPTPVPSPSPTLKGTLQGKLTIGPLCPVEPCNISDEQKKQAYEARKIQIYTEDKTKLITEITADYKTEMYSVDLATGKYKVIVTNAGIGPFEPKDIIISAGQTTMLNIDIDTGIR